MKRYEIWDAWVRYEDVDHREKRPVLIWNEKAFICYKITKTDRGDQGPEYKIKYWKEAGLSVQSYIRLGKSMKLVEADFVECRGTLDKRDQMGLEFRRAQGY